MSPDKIIEVFKCAQETGCLPNGKRNCLLCLDPCPDEEMVVGLWVPQKKLQRMLGCSQERLDRGGARVVLYMICLQCFERPTLEADIAATLLRRGTAQ
jgi:hypothetical protein